MQHRLALALWPAFLTSAVFNGLLFAFVDPATLEFDGQTLGLSRMTVYATSFFACWLFGVGCCALTLLLEHHRGDHVGPGKQPHLG